MIARAEFTVSVKITSGNSSRSMRNVQILPLVVSISNAMKVCLSALRLGSLKECCGVK